MFATVKTAVERMHPFVLLGAGLAAVLLFTASAGIWHHNYELSHQVQQANSQPASAEQVTVTNAADHQTINPDITVSTPTVPTNTLKTTSPNTAALQNAQPLQNNNPAAANPPQPKPPVPASVTVKLNINSVYKGDIVLLETNTQCDVLQKALENGVISSLDMRYSSQYKTYAVYAIEGQGDSGAIWWTYTVNGKSPPYGCSGTKVAAGDSVNWKYVKQ